MPWRAEPPRGALLRACGAAVTISVRIMSSSTAAGAEASVLGAGERKFVGRDRVVIEGPPRRSGLGRCESGVDVMVVAVGGYAGVPAAGITVNVRVWSGSARSFRGAHRDDVVVSESSDGVPAIVAVPSLLSANVRL